MNVNAQSLQVVAELSLPHGALTAVTLPAWSDESSLQRALQIDHHGLHAEEWQLAEQLAAPRRLAFVAGRLAVRASLQRVAGVHTEWPLLRTPRGAPRMPEGVLGSISHKRRLAVALVNTRSEATHTLGVDVEEQPDERDLSRPDLASRILTPLERHELAPLMTSDALAYREAVRLRFALKEAVYKAIDPHVQRYVRFQEVEVFPGSVEGPVAVRLSLPELIGRHLTVHAFWTRVHGHLVASAIGSQPLP